MSSRRKGKRRSPCRFKEPSRLNAIITRLTRLALRFRESPCGWARHLTAGVQGQVVATQPLRGLWPRAWLISVHHIHMFISFELRRIRIYYRCTVLYKKDSWQCIFPFFFADKNGYFAVSFVAAGEVLFCTLRFCQPFSESVTRLT